MRLLAFSLAVLVAGPVLAEPPSPAARALKDKGDAQRKAGEGPGALESYGAALRLAPRYAEVHEAIGEVQFGTKAYADAAASFSRAVELEPSYALAWYNLGVAARKAGDAGRARDAYVRYSALKPSDPDGFLGLAETARAVGDRAVALQAYEGYLRLAEGMPAEAPRVARARDAVASLRGEAAAAAPASSPRAAAPGPVAPAPAPTPATAGSAAVQEKLALGDKALAAGDGRGALFAYQDAVYLDARNTTARVRLARAYASLRYPDLAIEQLELALAADPGSADARRALEEVKAGKARAAAQPPTPTAAPAPAPLAATTIAVSPAAARPAARVYRVVAEEPPARAAEPAAVSAPAPVSAREERRAAAVEPIAPAESGPTPAQRYRAAVDLIVKREYARAIAELNDALAQDPKLAVGYAARASAHFGLGRYREASDDYRAALGLSPDLATPLYGLAECSRLLGDPAAADYYQRYVDSRASDVREDLRATARRRVAELRR